MSSTTCFALDVYKRQDIVIKGNCTYNQAVNIAKAGTLDSVKFDVKTQSVSCSITCGFSFVLGRCV